MKSINGVEMESIVEELLSSDEPSVRFKIRVRVLGEDPASRDIQKLEQEIRKSPRVKKLLSMRDEDGKIPKHPYSKWRGAHWTLSILADIGYPAGDESLLPLRSQVYAWLFGKKHEQSIVTIEGRTRRCASQESNAAYALLTLALADERADELVSRLISWQWQDGGWNCDRRPEAANSSFHESLIPLRALSLYAKLKQNKEAQVAAKRAAEIFLKRNMYKRQSDGKVIDYKMARLCYPSYWHYDILSGLKVMAEAGFIGDPRCKDALDLLESKRLPDRGFPAEHRWYRVYESQDKPRGGDSMVDWGEVSKNKMNPWVTADGLYVLQAAGRLS
jgi:hypothetical protein